MTRTALVAVVLAAAYPCVSAFATVSGGKNIPHLSSSIPYAFKIIPECRYCIYSDHFATSATSRKTSLAAFVDIDERVTRDISAFDEWSRACGVQTIPGFQLTTEDGVDWSVMTTDNIEAGGPVVQIPDVMILSGAKACQELGQIGNVQDALELLGRLDNDAAKDVSLFYLFLKIMVEYEQGDESPWYPWLNSLPRAYYNGAAMTPFCFECLPPLVAKMAKEERGKFVYFYQALKKCNFLSEQTKSDKDLARWAYNTVLTRSFNVGGDEIIVPMADMFNHGTETEIEITFDDEGNCLVVTTRDVPAGSPLRMSYGDPTNPSYLFARYGFLDESSPATFCKIMNIPSSPELRNIGLDFSRMLFYKNTGYVSEEVWDVLLYDFLDSDRDLQDVRETFYSAHMEGDIATKQAIHQRYLLETSSALKNHVDLFLERLDELTAKALANDPAEHPRIPLILEHNNFVRNTFQKVKENIDPLVAQALATR